MDRRSRGLGIVVAAVAVIAVGGCGSAQADDAAPESAEQFARVINVEVQPVNTQRFIEDIRLTSAVQANRDVMIAAEESGVIREVYVDKGSRVAAGDPIAKIDDALLSAQVDQARAAAELASQTWDRRKRLWEEDRVGSEIAYLEAKFAAEQSAANLSALQERLDRTVIRAPFEGVFDQRSVEIGSMVNPGQAIGRLVDLDPVKVLAGVPERYAPDVAVGAEAQLAFDVFGDRVFTAPVRYVGATVDPATRTFLVEVELRNPDGRIKPEMVANMSLTRRAVDDAVVVPQDALVRVEGGYVVFLAVEGDSGPVADARPVELGPSRRNQVVILSGVEAGDRLIVAGHKSVAHGDRVNVVAERE